VRRALNQLRLSQLERNPKTSIANTSQIKFTVVLNHMSLLMKNREELDGVSYIFALGCGLPLNFKRIKQT